jgi:hypothetical protein
MSQPAWIARVVALVGERVAAGVPEHVWVRLELQARASRGALDHSGEVGCSEWPPALADKHERWSGALELGPAGAHAARRLNPPVQFGTLEVDWSQLRSQASAARSPCRYVRRIIVASR